MSIKKTFLFGSSIIFNNAFEEMPVYLDSASTTKESEYSDAIGIRTPKFKYFSTVKNPEKNRIHEKS